MKKRIAVMLVALLLALSMTVQASEPFYSYTYSYQNGVATDVAAPVAYEEDGVYRDVETGCTFVTPEDLIADAAGNFYIVDSGANCVFVLDGNFRVQRTITGFINAAGEEDTSISLPACFPMRTVYCILPIPLTSESWC